MLKSREAQIMRKKSDREREKAEDAETAKFLGEWCRVLDQQEQEELELKHAAARRLAEEHKKQVDMHRGKKGGEKKGEELVAMRAKKAMEADTVEFHNYAESVIRAYSEEGK